MTVTERGSSRKDRRKQVWKEVTQRKTWTSWLGMSKGGTVRWAQDENLLPHGDNSDDAKPI